MDSLILLIKDNIWSFLDQFWWILNYWAGKQTNLATLMKWSLTAMLLKCKLPHGVHVSLQKTCISMKSEKILLCNRDKNCKKDIPPGVFRLINCL